jgi:DNA-directed RNA polymerase subunit A'
VKILPGKTMRIHVSVAFPYNADFDGDEMNMHVPQSIEAQAEARYLMQPKDMVLSPRDGKPIMFMEEDEVVGIHLLTKDDAYFTREETSLMLSGIGIYDFPKHASKGMYSGRSIFSMMLPKGMDFEFKDGSQKAVIKNGELVEGTITAKLVSEGGYLIRKIFEDYGAQFTMEFLLRMTKIALRTAAKSGVTISVSDYYNSDATNKERKRITDEVEGRVIEIATRYDEGKLESLPGYTKKETFELETMAQLEEARSIASKALSKSISTASNNAMLMASVKARGTILNFVQTSMFLGQQAVRGKRPSRGYSGRILPYFSKNDKSPAARGFIKSSFFDGLTPTEFFIHAMGSRDSAMSKSLVTAQSGYLQRRLINAMQDFYVDENLSVKDASGALIQTIYGGDGVDPTNELEQ